MSKIRLVMFLTMFIVSIVTVGGTAAAQVAVNHDAFPQSAAEAATKFGIPGQRSADSGQWQPLSGSPIVGWKLLPGDLTYTHIPPWAHFDGYNQDQSFSGRFGIWTGPLYVASVWKNDPIPENRALTQWPQSAAEAAAKFGVQESPSANPANWSRSQSEPNAWVGNFGGWYPLSIPHGARADAWTYHDWQNGYLVTTEGPWQDYVSDVTVRGDFRLYLPAVGMRETNFR